MSKITEQQKPWSEAATEENGPQHTNELQKAQGQRLRPTIFYITWAICLLLVLNVGIGTSAMLATTYNDMIDNNTLRHIYEKGVIIFSIINAIYYFLLAFPRWRNRSSAFAALRGAVFLIVVGGIVSAFVVDSHNGTDRWVFLLFPLISYGTPLLISSIVYNLKIKGWSIWQTMFNPTSPAVLVFR